MSDTQQRAAELIEDVLCDEVAHPTIHQHARAIIAVLANTGLLADPDTARQVKLGRAVENMDPEQWHWTRRAIYEAAGVDQ